MVSHSIWNILSYGHTRLKTPYDHLRWTKFGWSWTIGCESCVIVRCYTTSQPSRGIARLLVGFGYFSKTWLYRTIIARRSHLYGPSHDVVSWSCDVLRDHTIIVRLVQMMTSASRQTIIVKSNDLLRLSYDGRTMSYYFYAIIYVPAIVPNAP